MTHRYLIDATHGTDEWMSEQAIIDEFGSISAFQDYLITEAEGLLAPKVVQAFADQGVEVTFIALESVQIAWSRSGWWENGFVEYRRKVYFIASYYIDSEVDFFESPIAPLVIIAIGLAIALIVAAITVPYFLFQWLESTTTKKWEVDKYEWVQNPETGEWEWMLVSHESGQEPDIFATVMVIVTTVLVFAVAVPVGIYLYQNLPKPKTPV